MHQRIWVLVRCKGAVQQALDILPRRHRPVGHRLQQQPLQALAVLLGEPGGQICQQGGQLEYSIGNRAS